MVEFVVLSFLILGNYSRLYTLALLNIVHQNYKSPESE